MTASRYLIVNADDFGFSAGVNRGILRAHEQGIVTSASLMVRWPHAPEAGEYARSHPEFGVGLHADLGEWTFKDGEWTRLYEVVPLDDEAAVQRELESQLARFHELVGKDPTHLDSHQHFHREEPVRSLMLEMANRLGVPLRHFSPEVQYCGSFYGQSNKGYPYPEGITPEHLLDILHDLPAGITEMCCHPGLEWDHPSNYGEERKREVQALCDPRIRKALHAEGIGLISFASLPESSACPD